MKKYSILFLVFLITPILFSQNITSPEKFFGFRPGSDGMLFNYKQLIDYLKLIESQSDKMMMFDIGKSPMGKTMYAACFSSPVNLKNLEKLKEINRKLALEPTLDSAELVKLVEDGKVFVLATMSMHSTEVGPSQSVPLIAYQWLTTQEESVRQALENVVFMIVPNQNPDGMDMVVEDYSKNRGTKYEGSSLPGMYHKYTGHDNNRDFITLTQEDTRVISRLTSTEWFPQVLVQKHQMGSPGPRYFVQPNCDPIAENVDAELFIWTGIFGQQMINDMTAAGLKGVTQRTMYDNYWPGSTETCLWKNVIALLTEGANCRIASPVYIEPTELQGWGKGLSDYKKSINMPDPWQGGWWRLGDIIQYEIVSSNTLLQTASDNRKKILTFRNSLCRKEYNLGLTKPPYYFILPKNQADQGELISLVRLLNEHGISVYHLKNDVSIGKTGWEKGDIVVPLAQPFRSFIKEVMEAQHYPELHYTPGGELIEPYDITTWSLPLHKGLICNAVDTRSPDLEKSLEMIRGDFSFAIPYRESPYVILSSAQNQSFQLAFEALQKGIGVRRCSASFSIGGISIPAGSFLMETAKGAGEILKQTVFPLVYSDQVTETEWLDVKIPRIALVESYMQDIDAGWTRFVLDSYHVGFTVLHPGDFEKTDLPAKFDLIIFPDEEASVLKDGKRKDHNQFYLSNYRPEFTKGMGSNGFDSLISFFCNGGKIISWGESTALFNENLTWKSKNSVEEFRLPFRNEANGPSMKELNCPGSLGRMKLRAVQTLNWGMGDETAIFYRGNPLFGTSTPRFDMDRRVAGYFGENNLLISGFLEGEKLLANKAAMLWLRKGKGQMVLMAFSPVFRASVPATYKLLFNAILLPKVND